MQISSLEFNNTQIKTINLNLKIIKNKEWSLQHPIFLFNRSWFRLSLLQLQELHQIMPPDISPYAPELVCYQNLIKIGEDPLIALQECWRIYGIDDFHRAMRIKWESIELGNNSWTFSKYNSLLRHYRLKIEQSIFHIPLIVLARERGNDPHNIKWIHEIDSRLVLIDS